MLGLFGLRPKRPIGSLVFCLAGGSKRTDVHVLFPTYRQGKELTFSLYIYIYIKICIYIYTYLSIYTLFYICYSFFCCGSDRRVPGCVAGAISEGSGQHAQRQDEPLSPGPRVLKLCVSGKARWLGDSVDDPIRTVQNTVVFGLRTC